MKTIKILQTVAFIGIITFFTSCVVAHPYTPYAPAPSASLSLIVDPFPGIAVSRYQDGRYYYRNPQGYTYWRGYDNRYYLDRSYVGRGYYNHRDYNTWRRGGNYGGRHHRY
ncbi:MAG: hypothetical protein JST09_12780 [Bacteroidetes bacterium]|nr:hypothetical protein [Bacteroidota bacterium]MBS1608471.1 hypothetical protein [Bacteroidota bacterium]